jgi:hypothetical protein
LDRTNELRTIFNRLRHGESTAVVGEPHIGKSSLLIKLADEASQQTYLGQDAQCMAVCLMDLHPVGNDYTCATFWEDALEPLAEQPDGATIAPLLEQATQSGYARRSLERLFNHLGQNDKKLVLLLDEFERLLIHPNFQDPSFFALLRSLTTRTGGLAMITASRLSVAEMNDQGRRLLEIGSPFFNNVIELRLRPFDEITIGKLLDQAGEAFTSNDRRFIRRVAGRHPFLLQATAAAMLETTGDDRQAAAAERFYERISYHFDDLWRTMDDHTRTTAVVLSLTELGGRALGQSFAYGEIEKVDNFGPELRKLADRGLAEQVGGGWEFDWQHLLLWRGEQWTVGAQAFAWWIRDVIIAQSRQVPTYDEWLLDKRYRLLLTQEQWDILVKAVRSAPEWAMRGVASLARTLFKELVRRE